MDPRSAPLEGNSVSTSKPPPQVCPICAHDDDVHIELVDGEWVMRCTYAGHPIYVWHPTKQPSDAGEEGSGVAAELGVFDDLLVCVGEGFAETAVIEFRYWKLSPQTYRLLVEKYGHTAYGPAKYTASALLAGILRNLANQGLVQRTIVPATGYWSYNMTTGAYGPLGATVEPLSWERFAVDTLDVDPMDWPPLGYQSSELHGARAQPE